MKVAVACDHAGFELKATVLQTLKQLGHEPIDCVTSDCERVDFPDFAAKAAEAMNNMHRIFFMPVPFILSRPGCRQLKPCP